MLYNAGYLEALRDDYWDCFVFHDVDLLPEDPRNIYNCPKEPRHMSVGMNMSIFSFSFMFIFLCISYFLLFSIEHTKNKIKVRYQMSFSLSFFMLS